MGNVFIEGSFGIILLAAGASVRLGKPKQLLVFKGNTLLRHGVQVAIATGAEPIIVVLGANADLLTSELEGTNVKVIINNDWHKGMAFSIRCGLQKLQEIAPGVEAVILMVCDQPFVTTKLLEGLVTKYRETRQPVIASGYENSMGTPALFDKTIFAALLDLKGDSGAKSIMKKNPHWVDIVHFPLGNIDIDTGSDYEALLKDPPELHSCP